MRDKNGREVLPGDVVRVFHYRDGYTGRHVYMHKLIVLVDDCLHVTSENGYLYAVDVTDIWRKGSLDAAHKCRSDLLGPCEIIDGPSRSTGKRLECWYDRPKEPAAAKSTE